MINVLNQANVIIRVNTGKLANDNDRRKIKAAITEICNLFTLKKETIFTCTNEYSNTYICIYTFILTKKIERKYLNGSLKMGHQTLLLLTH